jgi:hypothetical protein
MNNKAGKAQRSTTFRMIFHMQKPLCSKPNTFVNRNVIFRIATPIYVSFSKACLDSLIIRATRRDAFFENVFKENPEPIAENPLRLFSAMSCSMRKTFVSDLIRALDAPSEKGRKTSI